MQLGSSVSAQPSLELDFLAPYTSASVDFTSLPVDAGFLHTFLDSLPVSYHISPTFMTPKAIHDQCQTSSKAAYMRGPQQATKFPLVLRLGLEMRSPRH